MSQDAVAGEFGEDADRGLATGPEGVKKHKKPGWREWVDAAVFAIVAAIGSRSLSVTSASQTVPAPMPLREAPGLTRRELEILQLIAEGLTNGAIATRLFISVNTVRNHVQGVLSKLGAHSKLEALSIAIRDGIIDPPRPASA